MPVFHEIAYAGERLGVWVLGVIVMSEIDVTE